MNVGRVYGFYDKQRISTLLALKHNQYQLVIAVVDIDVALRACRSKTSPAQILLRGLSRTVARRIAPRVVIYAQPMVAQDSAVIRHNSDVLIDAVVDQLKANQPFQVYTGDLTAVRNSTVCIA